MHLRKTAPTTVGLYHQLAQPRVALLRMLPASSALPALTRSHALSALSCTLAPALLTRRSRLELPWRCSPPPRPLLLVHPLYSLGLVRQADRPELPDEALLRPGRLEVKLEVSLPDVEGGVTSCAFTRARCVPMAR